jgi:hypothetical protein
MAGQLLRRTNTEQTRFGRQVIKELPSPVLMLLLIHRLCPAAA